MAQLTEQQQNQIESAIFGGRKIEAVMLYREATGADLIAAKNAVEAMEADLRQRQPGRFALNAGKGGCAFVLMFCAVLIGGIAIVVVRYLHF